MSLASPEVLRFVWACTGLWGSWCRLSEEATRWPDRV